MIGKVKRIYLKRTANHVTIINRNTHELLGLLSMDDKEGTRKTIKDICNMSTEEYIQYALGLGVRFRTDKQKQFIVNEDSEKWYEGAWATTTTNTLKELGMKDSDIPDDEITPELIEEVKHKRESVRAKKPLPKKEEKPKVKQPVEVVKEKKPQESTNIVELKDKKVKKALPKRKTEPKKNSLKEEYENGGMTIREYLRKRRESSEGVVR